MASMASGFVSSSQQKVCTMSRLVSMVHRLQRQGRRIVLTNGCFDLLHPGHVLLLERAKRLGDVLVVAINSDRSVKALKGPTRPILPQHARLTLVAALASVDYVTVFDEMTPASVIDRLRPDVLVKGADWKSGSVIGANGVKRRGGRVVRIPLVDGYSTTALLRRMAQQRGA
jgi:D-beta-D-heptose 7-phosphate kinase/D-beta-D-heptose 1-phosphate adenosyltransferase